MIFANPNFLYALGLLAVPIIIHLFSFRVPKRIVFTNVKLLREIKEETKSIQRIKSWVLLLLRCLAIAAIILAFASPIIPAKSGGQKNAPVVFYLDNSYSNTEGSIETNPFLKSKSISKSIVESYPENQEFIITSNSDETSSAVTKENALRAIDDLNPSSKMGSWTAINKKLTLTPRVQSVFMFSDFQKSNFPTAPALPDSTQIFAHKLNRGKIANLSIDSIAISTPIILKNQEFEIQVFITNHGELRIEKLPVQIEINGNSKAPINVDIEAGETKSSRFKLMLNQTGNYSGKISINDQPLSFDNDFYFSLSVEEQINVFTLAAQENEAIKRLFEGDADFNYTFKTLNQINLEDFENYNQTIILSDINQLSSGLISSLREFVDNGGVLAITPTANDLSKETSEIFQAFNLGKSIDFKVANTTINQLAYNTPFFTPLFTKRPESINEIKIDSYLNFTPSIEASTLISTPSTGPILTQQILGKGKVFFFGFDISSEESNFSSHGLFAPIFIRLTEYTGINRPSYVTIGKTNEYILDLEKSISQDQIQLHGNNEKLIVTHRVIGNQLKLYLANLPLRPGIYEITAGETSLGNLACNLGRGESLTAFHDEETIRNWSKNIELINVDKDFSSEEIENELSISDFKLWPFFIGLALIFLLTEMLWIRWQNKETT